MKREFLKAIEGLSDEAIDKIMAENGKDIETEKGKYTAYKTEVDTLKADKKTLEDKVKDMSTTAGDAETYKTQLEALQQQIKDKEESDKQAKADQELTDAITAVFGDKEFASDYVRTGIISDMKSEIAKPENKGKGYAELFGTLTKDKDGIFKNPNPGVNIDGLNTGAGVGAAVTKEAFNKMGYAARTKLFQENKELYDTLSKE